MAKDKKEKEMYLNKGLVYKVTDVNDKEIECPYFKSNQPGVQPLGQTPAGKKMIKNISYSLTQHVEMVEVSHYLTLLSFGIRLATSDGESKLSPAASNFHLSSCA